MKNLISCLFVILTFGLAVISQTKEDCSDIGYENKNQIDPKALELTTLSGRVVIGDESIALDDVCILLFDSKGVKLLATSRANSKGAFRFKGIKNGKYRLVIRHFYGFYCSANVPIVFRKQDVPRGMLVVRMVASGIDECSSGELVK